MRHSLIQKLLILSLGTSLNVWSFGAAWAGTHTGGGGGNIVCFKSAQTLKKVRAQGGKLATEDLRQIDSIEAYDLYEARVPRDLKKKSPYPVFDLLPSEQYSGDEEVQDYAGYIERLAQRFDFTVPLMSGLIRLGLQDRDRAMVSYVDGVAQVDDADGVVDVPDVLRCALVTTAVQYDSGDKFYLTFDRRLMSHPKNSQLSRAVLNLHENLYHLGRSYYSHDSSRPTRNLLAQILRKDVPWTAGGLFDLITDLGFYRGKYQYGEVNNAVFTTRQAYWAVSSLQAEANRAAVRFDELQLMDSCIDEYRTWGMYVDRAKIDWKLRFDTVWKKVWAMWQSEKAALLQNPINDPRMLSLIEDWLQGSRMKESGVIRLGKNGNILPVNGRMCKITLYSEGDGLEGREQAPCDIEYPEDPARVVFEMPIPKDGPAAR